ncbi:Protein of uncharacterised function (DUF1365) [Mycolicibacterium aurum]|uniref:Protein of uncharacterized function (DUF1365) n=1 Tax=Mycolicibacterium aurum TaxID=1791 RepID=A0A3S4S1F4_MYCAU|nr:DUF1365 family protein [Mycolicibacterium aurum]VEG57629.1 Protein of uncharacterised function (DUF1365) [Mycolicibacterium aurum]
MSAALYRTRITHLRRAPVHHYFEHRSYSWFLDLDDLPRLPRWLRPFARFDVQDHLWEAPNDTLRGRVDAFLASKGIDLSGGKVTALMQARVLGHVFNPMTLYWCHDARGTLRYVVVEVQNTYGERHAYLLPPSGERPAMVDKKLYMSPFNDVDGHYLVQAPEPEENLDVTISLHRENQPALVTTLRGARRPAGVGNIVWLQLVAPVAPLMNAFSARVQVILLSLRRVPVVPRRSIDRVESGKAVVRASDESASATVAPALLPAPIRHREDSSV